MERPFAVIGFAALAALMASVFMGAAMALVVSGVCMACFLTLFLLKKRGLFKQTTVVSAVLAAVSLALLLFGVSDLRSFGPWQRLDGTDAVITAVVQGYPEERNGRFYYQVKVTSLQDGEQEIEPFRIRLSAANAIRCEPYDTIRANVRFSAFRESYGFSSRSSYRAKGIALSAYMRDYRAEVTPAQHRPFRYYFQYGNRLLTRQIELLLPREEAAVTNAMLLGDGSGISGDIDFAFRKTGTTHLLVVSGMHMTLVSALALGLLSVFKVRGKAARLLTMAAVASFMLLTGGQTSVLRSGLMCLLYESAQLLDRDSDSVNTLGLSVLLICLFNPHAGGDIGFLLSVFATLGILKLAGPMRRAAMRPLAEHQRLKRLLSPVIGGLCVGLAATLFVMPIQICLFGGFSLIGPAATLLLSVPCTLILYFAFFALLLSFCWLPLAAPFTFLTGLCAKASVWMAEKLALADGYIGVSEGYGVLALCGILVLLAFFLCMGRSRRTGQAAIAMSLCVLVVSGAARQAKYSGSLTVAICRAGESPVVVLMQGERAAVLAADGYNTAAVREVLMTNNIRQISGLLLTSDSRETVTAADEIAGRYPVMQAAIADGLYLPGTLRNTLDTVPKLIFSGETPVDWLENAELTVSENGVCLFYGQTALFLETGDGFSGRTDLLITANPESFINSAFTVLLTDDTIEAAKINAGHYLLSGAQKITYLDLFPDGRMQIRRAG